MACEEELQVQTHFQVLFFTDLSLTNSFSHLQPK